MTDTAIPLVDLKAQFANHRAEIMAAIEAVIADCAFVQGPHVAAFEQAFAARMGVRHAIGCSSGTSALTLPLEALGIGPGDEVITVAHTFFATVEAVCQLGARPVFVDVDPLTCTMDPAAAAAALSPRTKALLPVHLYGTPCHMDELGALARAHGLALVEDAAQAHLATYKGKTVGAIGDATTFSFYPGKNLGAYGDAGLVSTDDDRLAARMRKMRDHGRSSKYEHDAIGYNHRMDGIQGAVLAAKLVHLDAWTAARRAHGAAYDARLAAAGFQVARTPAGAVSSYHLYVAQVSNRDRTQAALAAAGIASGVHYPVPLHLQPALAGLGGRPGMLPVTERLAGRVLSLPIYPELSDAQRERICDVFLAVAQP